MQKTTVKQTDRSQASWFVVDASQEVLGRMATEVARRLMGKHKPEYTPHADVGDFIVVINASKVQLTGAKKEKKVYRWHTHHPGGLREVPFARMNERHPEDIIRLAVRRMMPKTNLGRQMMKKLKIYAGDRHEHHAQKPTPISFGSGANRKKD
ncbi:MAG: 50S ribosomal protein L13 [Planctomycetota bacterium]|nr:50S ribosomal protein L13 [Planctomycetota bacterium]